MSAEGKGRRLKTETQREASYSSQTVLSRRASLSS